jgi:hypothetical protein
LRGLLPDSGKPFALLYEPGERLGELRHGEGLEKTGGQAEAA